jgi:two-component system, cell cycle sensor histidine kinase and response regulator CckA
LREKLRILIVEDEPADAELARMELRRAGLDFEAMRVETEAALRTALVEFAPDLILADFTLPGFDALGVLAVVRDLSPTTPVLVVTGTIDEETAVSCLRAGAADYLLKDRLGRLGSAVTAALASRSAEEERRLLTAAVEQIDEAVLVTGRDGRILWVNRAFERMTGWPRGEVLGKNPRLLKSGRQDAAFYESMWSMLRRGEVWRGRLANRGRDGGLIEVDATISPVRDASGTVRHYVSVQRDVTRETTLQRQLELSQRVEALGRMAGGIAHDFNNLLGVIRGYAELLLRYPHGEDDLRAALEEVISASDRGARLTSQLLAFGRRQLLRPHAVDLRAALGEMDGMLRKILGEGVTLEVLSPGPVWARVDPSRLEQVVLNLVVNARDAMPAGGRMTIEARAERDGGGAALPARLRFTDTGEGMPPEVLEHVFEPFFTTKAEGKGTGLGLSTVYGVVTQSGGSVTVESVPGRGTTFEVTLPPSPPADDDPGSGSGMPVPRGQETLLVVEDQAVLRAIVVRALSEQGYRVLEAAGPDEGLRLAALEGPRIDLVLTDVVMPGAGGRALVEALRVDHPDLKALFMSGHGAEALAPPGVANGNVRVLPKPFRLEDLARAVREALDDPG